MQRSAFTLVEVILAITLLSLVLTIVAGLVITGIRVNTSHIHQLQAIYIAEEGVEIVRNLRDSNWWQNKPFNDGIADGCYTVSADVLYTLTSSNCDGAYLYVDEVFTDVPLLTDGPLGDVTFFRRFIEIDNVTATQFDLTSTVLWNERGAEKTLAVTTTLTDWKGGPL